jgi:hypothetical protein
MPPTDFLVFTFLIQLKDETLSKRTVWSTEEKKNILNGWILDIYKWIAIILKVQSCGQIQSAHSTVTET